MDADTLVSLLVVILVFAGLLLLRVPVAISLAGASLLGVTLDRGVEPALAALGAETYNATSDTSLIVIPLFILMGILAVNAGLADDAFNSAQRVLNRLPGGPAVAALAGSGIFAAVTGSSVATVATFAQVSTKAVRKAGYHIRLAAGAVGAGGTLGVLIPPSIVLIIYGVIGQESIGALLIAGIVPGILSLAIYSIAAVIYGSRLAKKYGRQPVAVGADNEPRQTQPDVADPEVPTSGPDRVYWASLLQLVVLFFAAVGTIYVGIATPTEAASLGAIGGTLILVGHYFRRPKHLVKTYGESLTEAAGLTAMIFLLLVGAGLFNYYLALTGVTSAITSTLSEAPIPAWAVLLLALLMLVLLGMFLDGISIILLATPVLHPLLTGLGYDGIWIGVLVVKVAEMALITPPVGLNAFVYKGAVKDISLADVFKGLSPFLLADVVTVALLFTFPALVTWLPTTAGLM